MELKELCDLLEVGNFEGKQTIAKLADKLGHIIMRFNADWPTSSFLAAKGGRGHKDLEYLKEKGLFFLHREDVINGRDSVLYKLTAKGVEAYETYIAL